jgi:hypothetical protein
VMTVNVEDNGSIIDDKSCAMIRYNLIVFWLTIVSRSWQAIPRLDSGAATQDLTLLATSPSLCILKWISILPSLKGSKTPIIVVYNKFDHCISRL